jgi:hypothetical protein
MQGNPVVVELSFTQLKHNISITVGETEVMELLVRVIGDEFHIKLAPLIQQQDGVKRELDIEEVGGRGVPCGKSTCCYG